MKICHVTNYLPNYHKIWGGAEQAALKVINISKNKHEVSILSTKPLQILQEFDFHFVKTLDDFLGKAGTFFKFLIPYDPISYFSCKKILKKINPDIIHLHNFDRISLAIIDVAHKLKIPIIFSIYDYWSICPRLTLINHKNEICHKYNGSYCSKCFKNYKLGWLRGLACKFRKSIFDKYLSKITAFIVLSNSSKKILYNYGIPNEKIHIIHIPLMNKFSLSSNKKVEKNSILFTGWINYNKGLHILIRALPKIIKENPKIKLYIVGKDANKDYKQEILDYIKKNKLDKNIDWIGELSNEKVMELMKKSNILVIPEQWENMCPIILIESIALGKAIVASNVGGIPEFIENNKNGLLVKHNNPNEFSKKILYLLKNPKKANLFGKKSQEKFKKIFDRNTIIRELLSLYEGVKTE